MGEASGKSQKTVKDAELETEFLIINKREDRTLYMEGLGCGSRHGVPRKPPTLSPQDSLVSVQVVSGTRS